MHHTLGVFLPGFFDSFAHRSSRFRRRRGQNSPTASLSGRSSGQTVFPMPVSPALTQSGQI